LLAAAVVEEDIGGPAVRTCRAGWLAAAVVDEEAEVEEDVVALLESRGVAGREGIWSSMPWEGVWEERRESEGGGVRVRVRVWPLFGVEVSSAP